MTHVRLLALTLLALPAASAAPLDPVSGSWKGLLNGFAPLEASLTLKGNRVTGVTHFAKMDFPVTGSFNAQKNLVTYTFKWVDGKTATVNLKLGGNTLSGTYQVHTNSKENIMTLTRVSSTAASAPGKAGPYVMTGVVRDEKGKPLAGVEVFADHTAFYNMNALGKTDAQGRYRIALAHQPGTWNAGAYLRGEVGRQLFEVRLSPDDDTPFDGSKGAVRNFTYKASDAPGGKVYTSIAHSNVELDYDSLEFTFTPDGPNATGSTRPFTRKFVVGSGVQNVPLGRYRVSATQVLNGVRQQLLLSSRLQKEASTNVRAAFTHDSHYGETLELFLNNP
ncbi:hypothetical protein E7T06_04950 [Deinococcus sp. Arct2-2]|uniref:hypothetical protein n=1 Tax=Deinococcus sp. Arct2-2 TaxID=2568653 RepID=UPI0010A2BC35|nr:hypothetical protein [Deinococcus sp. Arct2-2]THF70910.1 hypothetical protein E7T06_04950 [Deinococcus sp. Arct2-2]